jgi:hypothetical protein
MSGADWLASDEVWAARHKNILTELVMVLALAARHNRTFRAAVEQVPVWPTAEELVFREQAGAGAPNASALLRELVTGIREVAKRDPTVARLFSNSKKSGWTVWSVAEWAVGDARQWRRVPNAGQTDGRRSRSATPGQQHLPASPQAGRPGSARRP